MKNAELADMFSRMADLMEILEQDHFRIVSYQKVSRVLSELAEPIEDLAAAGKLQEIPGIGKSTAEKIEQYLKTGKIAKYEELAAQVPAQAPEMLKLPGLGPKTVARLWKELNITSLDALRELLTKQPDKLIALKGMGEKKVEQLQQSLSFVESTGGRIRLGEADALAAALAAAVRKSKGSARVVPAGSLRRGRETIGDIDLLCEATADQAVGIIEAFTSAREVKRVLAKGETKGSVITGHDVQADLRVVPTESFGAALAYFTGSKAHNIGLRELAIKKGWKLNEYGLFSGDKSVAGATEDEIYAKLGLPFIAPELREDRGEIEAALAGKLPEIVELADIQGDFHMHTTASDGMNSIDEMIDACRKRGYKYLCISDHSKGQRQANGLDESRLADHIEAIRAAGKRHKDIYVLAGCEVDILKDGGLDFEADVLAELDFVTASCHSYLKMERAEATARIIKAIESPHVHCIGHPSGRLINERPGMEIDIEKIARAAAANGVALEINAHWMRLDLRDTHVRVAVDAGAKIAICSDAHTTAELDVMKYGVITARRGWATKAEILNTMSPAQLKKWLEKKGRLSHSGS
ncbi:MAG: DNA polymerase/3'-5' exonuclease PolX [Phycisphaerae bacterium]